MSMSLGQAGTIGVLGGFPVLQLHHHLDTLLLPDGPDPKQGRNIDQPDPTNLHMMGRQLVSPPDQDVVAPAGHLHHVIRYQPVTSLDQIEHALAFADS